jgi:hypothetical protein
LERAAKARWNNQVPSMDCTFPAGEKRNLHHYFAQKPPCTSQIKFKGIMAPTVPKFGLTLREGPDGTAGALAGSPVAVKRQKMAVE